MANVETAVLTGVLEDEQGRKLMPDTTAAQVVHSDGETVETKFNKMTATSSMGATLAASATKTVVDLSSYITDRAKRSYRIEILTSVAENESPVATVIAELIGNYAVFYRQGIAATKEVTITYRLVSIPLV